MTLLCDKSYDFRKVIQTVLKNFDAHWDVDFCNFIFEKRIHPNARFAFICHEFN